MTQSTFRILYLDDYHAGDVLFLQTLARALGRWNARPAPVLVHGSGEAAERALESKGIFRTREGGLLPVESPEEHRLVNQAGKLLNQHILAVLNDAVVSAVGVVGTQRRTLMVEDGRVAASGAEWILAMVRQGVVPVLAAFAREARSGATGEVPIADAVAALAAMFGVDDTEIVFFTRTNLPGIMEGGRPRPRIEASDPRLDEAVPDLDGLKRLRAMGLPVLLTNTTRLADRGGPIGTAITDPAV